MNNQPDFTDNPIIARNLLSQFDLTPEEAWDIVEAAVTARYNCTKNDPRSAFGWEAWRMGNRRLREILLKKKGWHWSEDEGIPAVFHLEKRIKITVCNTDGGTGLLDQIPQQTSKKGSATERNIKGNQLSLFKYEADKPVPISKIVQPGCVTCWYFLIFCDCESDVVRAELSLPVLSEDGLFTEFRVRIVLTDPGSSGEGAKLRKPAPESGGDFEIPVTRKKAS